MKISLKERIASAYEVLMDPFMAGLIAFTLAVSGLLMKGFFKMNVDALIFIVVGLSMIWTCCLLACFYMTKDE